MNCPVCQKLMVSEDFGGVTVNVCRDGCMGIWFDQLELRKLDDKNEGLGDLLKEALASPRHNDGDRGTLNCPLGHGPMHRHICNEDKQVNVDECYTCGGFFLDSGELEDIREHHMTEAEQDAYGEKLLGGISEYSSGVKELHEEQARAEAITKFTRFMRLSYYVTGK